MSSTCFSSSWLKRRVRRVGYYPESNTLYVNDNHSNSSFTSITVQALELIVFMTGRRVVINKLAFTHIAYTLDYSAMNWILIGLFIYLLINGNKHLKKDDN